MPKLDRDTTATEEDGNLQQLTLEVNSLKHSVNRIQEDVNELKNALVNLGNTQENVIELKEIQIEEAKAQILSYLEAHEYSWTSEIAEALGIDYLVINRALHELKEEGVLDSRSE